MRRSLSPWLLCTAVLVLGARAQVQAQNVPAGPVTGRGTVELKKLPNIVRIHAEVLAKGKDLKEALALLKDRRKAAQLRLAALGVSPEAVVFNEPTLGSEKTDQQRAMERMVASRLGRRKNKEPAKGKSAAPTVVAAILKADIPFKAADPEEVLLRFQTLKEKILAADLCGMKEFKKLTPQEEEIAEETDPEATMGNEGEPRQGEPVFMLVAKIPQAEQAKALAEAFQKAKREATQLARAAGMGLGALRQLDNQSAVGTDENPYPARAYSRLRIAELAGADSPGEAIGLQPGRVTYRVTIIASFELK